MLECTVVSNSAPMLSHSLGAEAQELARTLTRARPSLRTGGRGQGHPSLHHEEAHVEELSIVADRTLHTWCHMLQPPESENTESMKLLSSLQRAASRHLPGALQLPHRHPLPPCLR